jgi:hypothetical protein
MSGKDARYNRSEKGRARYERYRASEKGQANEHCLTRKEMRERKFTLNRRGAWSTSTGSESSFPYPREVVEAHLLSKLLAFKQKQAEEYEEFSSNLDATNVSEPQSLKVEELLPLPPHSPLTEKGNSTRTSDSEPWSVVDIHSHKGSRS